VSDTDLRAKLARVTKERDELERRVDSLESEVASLREAIDEAIDRGRTSCEETLAALDELLNQVGRG